MKYFALSALLASTQAVVIQRGDAYPAPILPGSAAIMPIASDPILLQQSIETFSESRSDAHIRHKL
jgi:hypothetical protein